MSQITHLLIKRLETSLTASLLTAISSSSPTRAKKIQAYRFQENPLEENIYLWVAGGNPEDPNDRDARVGTAQMEGLGMELPRGEVGGGHLWWRKGHVEVGCYFVREHFAQSVAGDYAHIVLGRTMNCIERTQVSDLVDEFGEQAVLITVYASAFFEGGGPPNQYLWRGKVLWQALTERPY